MLTIKSNNILSLPHYKFFSRVALSFVDPIYLICTNSCPFGHVVRCISEKVNTFFKRCEVSACAASRVWYGTTLCCSRRKVCYNRRQWKPSGEWRYELLQLPYGVY